MLRVLPVLLFVACACGSKAADAPPAGKHVIRAMQLNNEGKTSHIEFESSFAQGTIEIAPDARIDYKSITVVQDNTETSRTVITLDGKALDFWGPELMIGERSYGKLSGAVQVQISRDRVLVNDEQR